MAGSWQIVEFGPLDAWGGFSGGYSPQTQAPGRKFVDREMDLDFFGVSINSRRPGEGADYWHSHSVLEELYLFLEGEGELALDGEIVPVKAGSAVRVGQGVLRTWRCVPNSPVPLKWICVRGGGAKLKDIPKDAAPIRDRALPWTLKAPTA